MLLYYHNYYNIGQKKNSEKKLNSFFFLFFVFFFLLPQILLNFNSWNTHEKWLFSLIIVDKVSLVIVKS